MKRRLLIIDAVAQSWQLETLRVEVLEHDARADYFVLSGETLCQYLLRRDADSLIIARGPMAFLSGNKASVGYISPLTGVPHYSFVGGRAAAQLLNLGIDAIWFVNGEINEFANSYLAISGRAPDLNVEFKSAAELPAGQRGAFYWLSERELDGKQYTGSIFTLGEGARLGYRAANLAADIIYHAGRGGAGAVFARFAAALVLRGEPLGLSEFFAGNDTPFARNPNDAIAPLLNKYCARLSRKTGGTVNKLYDTGGANEFTTLPAWNARRVGTPLAELGSERFLSKTRQGQTGCHWCQVDCRHWHWVPADYAPAGRDIFLDDFEPTYATFAILGLVPDADTFQAKLDLWNEVEQRLILPIEQMGCDIMDIGIGLAALFEGVEREIIPHRDVPDFIAESSGLGKLSVAGHAVKMLRTSEVADYPALRAVGDGPQALAELYPAMRDIVFTSGKGTLGNAGHSNALWTFLMPFSRFFGHYSGQIYKIDEELPPPGAPDEAYRACFERVVRRMLEREYFWLLCNALSQCAFTFVIFSQDGAGERLSDDDLLVRVLRNYGIETTRADLRWFSQAFWAQSIDLKCQFGWQPPTAGDLPRRVYESLTAALGRSPDEWQNLMARLIAEWKLQAGRVMEKFGYRIPW